MRFDSACNLCGSQRFNPFATRRDGIPVIVCSKCQHGTVEHFPDDVQSLYPDAYFNSDDHKSGYGDYAFMAEHGVAWAAALVKLLLPSGSVLDIGCADGHLLKKLGPGYSTYGIEPNATMAAKSGSAGIRMIASDLLDGKVSREYAESFDIVLAIAVFEHIPDFKRAVEAALEMTAPNGLLIFEVPVLRDLQPSDPWLSTSLEHIHYPTLQSLQYLFDVALKMPIAGTVLEIRHFANTYVGVVAKAPAVLAEVKPSIERWMTGPAGCLSGDEARFRWLFDFLHASKTTPEVLALWPHVPAGDFNPLVCRRVSQLFLAGQEHLTSLKEYVTQVESAVAWHAEEVRKRDEIVSTLQDWIFRLETDLAWHAEELRHREQTVSALQDGICQLEAIVAGKTAELQKNLAALRGVSDAEHLVQAMRRSWSWRLTSPLRALLGFIRN